MRTASRTQLPPTRAGEAERAAALLKPGSALLIVGHPGEGRTAVALACARLRARTQPAHLRCTSRTQPKDLLAAFEASPSGLLVLSQADRLPLESVPTLEALTQDPRARVLLPLDVSVFSNPRSFDLATTEGSLNDLWRRGQFLRLDLGRLPDGEILELLRSKTVGLGLDDLQTAALAHAADGSLALALDLAVDAEFAFSGRVPRHLSAPWAPALPVDAHSSHRIASRTKGLDERLLAAASALHQIGPLPRNVAETLLGPDIVSRLVDSGLAILELETSAELVHVDAVRDAGLRSAQPFHDLGHDRDALDTRLNRLWEAGLTLPGSAVLGLARSSLREGRTEGRDGLLLSGAAIAARVGDGEAASALIRGVTHDELRPDFLPVAWYADLLLHRHGVVLEQAHRFFREHPEDVHPGHLHRACAAASWQPATPQWLLAYLREKVEPERPVQALVLRTLMGDDALDADSAARLEAAAGDPRTPQALAPWALALATLHHAAAGAAAPLLRCIDAGRELRRVPRPPDVSADLTAAEGRLFLDVVQTGALLVAGMQRDETQADLRRRTHDAVCFGSTSGNLACASAAALHAVVHLVAGETPEAKRDAATALSYLDRATFSTVNDVICGLVSGAMEHPAAPGTASPPPGRRSLLEGPTAWQRAVRVQTDALEGRTTVRDAAAEMRTLGGHDRFASVDAIARHLTARADHDAEGLVAAAELLTGSGQTRAAVSALACAHTLFKRSRQTARADECASLLASLSGEAPLASATATGVLDIGTPPAGLSRREFEICLLVAEGLTNSQIAERLVVSVRTVESHVLQARSKLKAPRRKDIPDRLSVSSGA